MYELFQSLKGSISDLQSCKMYLKWSYMRITYNLLNSKHTICGSIYMNHIQMASHLCIQTCVTSYYIPVNLKFSFIHLNDILLCLIQIMAIRMADRMAWVRVLVWTLVSFVRNSDSCLMGLNRSRNACPVRP